MMVLMKQMAIISLGIFMCIEIMATSFTWIHLYVLGLNFIFTMQHEMIYSDFIFQKIIMLPQLD